MSKFNYVDAFGFLIAMFFSCHPVLSVAQEANGVQDPAQRVITPSVIREIGKDRAGHYLVGDMVFTESELNNGVIGINGGFIGNYWPGGKVFYTFDADIEESLRQVFRRGASWWSDVSGLQFFESPDAGNRIRVVIPDEGGCNSRVGMVGGEQIINLGIGCWTPGVVAHEIGHALGLKHEQSRSDRAPHVTVVTSGGVSTACNALITANWGIYSTANLTAYDFDSIMHYPSVGGLSSPDCSTGVSGTITAISAQPAGLPSGSESVCLTPAQCTSIMGNRTELSARDGLAMASRYGYRISVSAGGDGDGSFSASGHRDSCGSNCFLATPSSTFRVNASPAPDSVVRFSGACSGSTCTLSPSNNGQVRVSFIKQATLMKTLAILSMTTEDHYATIFSHGFEN